MPLDASMTGESVQLTQRSTFVSVLTWIYIVIGGLGTFITFLEFVVFQFLIPANTRSDLMMQMNQTGGYPELLKAMFAHIGFFLLFFMLISAAIVVSAIALLKRKNWARIVFLVLMTVSVLWNIIALAIRFFIGNSGVDAMPPQFHGVMVIINIFSIVLAVGFTALFIVAIIKLSSDDARKEFGLADAPVQEPV